MIPSHLPQGQSQAFSTFPKVPAHTLTHGHTRPPSSTQYLWAVKHQQGHLEFLAYIYVQFAVGKKNMQHQLVLSLSQNVWKMIPSWLDAAPVERQLLMARSPVPPLTLPCFSFARVFLFCCCFSMFLICLCFPRCQGLILFFSSCELILKNKLLTYEEAFKRHWHESRC